MHAMARFCKDVWLHPKTNHFIRPKIKCLAWPTLPQKKELDGLWHFPIQGSWRDIPNAYSLLEISAQDPKELWPVAKNLVGRECVQYHDTSRSSREGTCLFCGYCGKIKMVQQRSVQFVGTNVEPLVFKATNHFLKIDIRDWEP